MFRLEVEFERADGVKSYMGDNLRIDENHISIETELMGVETRIFLQAIKKFRIFYESEGGDIGV